MMTTNASLKPAEPETRLTPPAVPISIFLPVEVDLGPVDPGLFAVAAEDSVGQKVDVDVDLVRPRPRQKLEDVLHYGFVRDRGQGLRDRTREREEPRALAGRQYHRFHENKCLSIKKIPTSRRNRTVTDDPPLP